MTIRERPTKLDFPLDKGMRWKGVIYVPSTMDKSRPISDSEFKRRINKVSRTLSSIFGGDTIQRMAYGNWIDEKTKKLVSEKIARIEFYAKKNDYLRNDSKLGDMIHKLAKQWGQWAISYEFQTDKTPPSLHFVPSDNSEFQSMIFHNNRKKLRSVA